MLTQEVKDTIAKFIENFIFEDKDVKYEYDIDDIDTNVGQRILVFITIYVDIEKMFKGPQKYEDTIYNIYDNILNDFKYLGFGQRLIPRVNYECINMEGLEKEVSSIKSRSYQLLKDLNFSDEEIDEIDLYFSTRCSEEDYFGIQVRVTYEYTDSMYSATLDVEDMIADLISKKEYPYLYDLYINGDMDFVSN